MPTPKDNHTPTVVSIGTFDGVHAGHRAIIARARDIAGPTGRVVALAFDPHPIAILRPDIAPQILTPIARRAELLREAGADEVQRLEADRALLALSPEAFIDHVVESFRPIALVEGPDFSFGKARAGNVEALAELGRTRNFTLEVVPEVDIQLTDQTLHRASSSLTRTLLAAARVADAAAVLGRPHELPGTVTKGDRIGRSIGFPTINITTEAALPADAVYAGFAALPATADRPPSTLPAAINIGNRPTVNGLERRVEAHILGLPTSADTIADPNAKPAWAPIEGLPEYDWPVTLQLTYWLRDQARFGSLQALAAQLTRDCKRATDLLESPSPVHTRYPAPA